MAQSVADFLDVHALVDQPRGVGMADLVRGVMERQVCFLDCLFPDPAPGVVAYVLGGVAATGS